MRQFPIVTELTKQLFMRVCVWVLPYVGEGKLTFVFVDTQKLSTKDVNKNQNQLDHNKFKHILQTQQSSGGCNTGYRTDGKCMFTYQQHRNSLSYLYIKRKVLDDVVNI